MRTTITLATAIVVGGILTAAYSQGLPNSSSPSIDSQLPSATANRTFQEISAAAPVPTRTPYADDVKKDEQYIYGFRHGYTWAFGDTPYCPTNPNGSNDAVMHGWIDGWRTGAKDGGTNGLPSKYAPFVTWRTTN